MTARGRLTRADEFENIIVRSNGPNGALRIKDVASVGLDAINYDTAPTVDGKPAIGMAVFLAPGANALNTATAVKARLVELKKTFPADVDYIIPFDTTIVVKASIHEVEVTIFEAAVLVLAVVFLFLQTWRATVIPMLAVPVSIVGTFAGLFLLGLSINVLTLFAMVLAIGIVVDDAIVVLENVERLMRVEKMDAMEASIEAMREVSGALIAIILVLCSVFIPVAFLGGIAGQLYKQFAVTVTVAVVISGFVALTLTPALCALLLKPGDHESKIFRPFNVAFDKTTKFFLRGVDTALARRTLSLIAGLVVFADRGPALLARAHVLRARRGPGLPHRLHHPSGRRIAAAHAEDRRRSSGTSCRRTTPSSTPSWCRAATSSAGRTSRARARRSCSSRTGAIASARRSRWRRT